MQTSKTSGPCQTRCTDDTHAASDARQARRVFMIGALVGGMALTATRAAAQAAGPPLTETDPQAVALGFKVDNTKVDKAKYPQHAANQMCGGCNFYQGKPTDATAPCQLFANKQVPQKGWCAAWAKKP